MDFNAAICRDRQFGYPLLNDLTMTETLDCSSGDSVYLPGSIVCRGKRQVLGLHGWTGRKWEVLDRSESYYVPAMQVMNSSGLIPLTRLHRLHGQRECDIGLSYYSTLIQRHQDAIAELLIDTIAGVRDDRGKEEFLRALLHNCMSRDGRVRKLELGLSSDGVQINECRYQSVDDVVRAALGTVAIAFEREGFADLLAGLPSWTPLFSGPFHTVLYALLDTHRPSGDPPLLKRGDENIIHVHWAATQMAGYPPLVKGYFHSNVRHYRRMFLRLAPNLKSTRTIVYVVAPASVFTLCPSSEFPDDSTRLVQLFREVTERCSAPSLTAAEMHGLVSDIAESWWRRNNAAITSYHKSNFGPTRSVATDFVPPERGRPVISDEFLELTFMQASMLVGQLHRLVGSELL